MDSTLKSGHGGRPTHDESAHLSAKILDTAQRLFLAQGFERTSIDQIAAAAHVAKRTLYARFDGKEGVFDAVVKRRIDQNLLAMDKLEVGGVSLEEKLRRLAYLLLEHVLEPEATQLDRAIIAEAVRFPNLARLYREHAGPFYREYILRLLMSSPLEYTRPPAEAISDANIYLILIVLPLMRQALFSNAEPLMIETERGVIEQRLLFFMKGIRG